jgi:hypothetical protein
VCPLTILSPYKKHIIASSTLQTLLHHPICAVYSHLIGLFTVTVWCRHFLLFDLFCRLQSLSLHFVSVFSMPCISSARLLQIRLFSCLTNATLSTIFSCSVPHSVLHLFQSRQPMYVREGVGSNPASRWQWSDTKLPYECEVNIS